MATGEFFVIKRVQSGAGEKMKGIKKINNNVLLCRDGNGQEVIAMGRGLSLIHIFATVVVSVFRSFGHTVESRLIWSTESNTMFIILLSVLFGGMILYSLLTDRTAWKGYKNIIKSYGLGGTDYYKACLLYTSRCV